MDLPDGTRFTADRLLRPLRIGYEVDPRSSADLTRAAQTASLHWGGTLHALLPSLRSRPSWWYPWPSPGPFRTPFPTAEKLAEVYAQAFEPDVVVDARSDGVPPTRGPVSRREVLLGHLRTSTGQAPLSVGMSVLPVFARLWQDEYRFASEHRREVVLPQPISPEYELFVDICFGRFPSDRADFRDTYTETFRATELPVTADNLLELFSFTARQPLATPFGVGRYGLEVARFGIDRGVDVAILVADPSDPVDLFDYWNLRASGRTVVCLPGPWVSELATPLGVRVLEQQVRGATQHITVYGGRRSGVAGAEFVVRELQAMNVSAWLSPAPGPDPGPHGDLNAAFVQAEHDEIDLVASRGTIEIPLLAPRMRTEGLWSFNAWVNTITFRSWTLPRDGSVAPFVPSRLKQLHGVLGAIAPSDARAGQRGLQFLSSVRPDKVTITPPSGRRVIHALLAQEGYEPKASDAGTVAEKLVEQMGGIHETSLLRHIEVLEVLNRAANTGVELAAGLTLSSPRIRVNFIPRHDILKALGKAFGKPSIDLVLHQLVARNVLRLGLVLGCNECGFPNWLELGAIQRTLQCDRCLASFQFPEATPPDQRAWGYRPTGACSVENFARGSYAVAQSLRVLESHEPMIWCTGTQISDSIEVDFAIIRRQRNALPRSIFGEAKTLGPLKDADFRRAREVLRRFKDCTFVFTTFRAELTEKEKAKIARLARPNPRTVDELPYHARVMVLTKLELSGNESLSRCWERAGGRVARIAQEAAAYARDDIDLWADITLQLHVGLDPHTAWWKRETERRDKETVLNAKPKPNS